jgi:zinc protease
LAYSTHSYLYPLDRAGIYLGGVATANDRMSESVEVIRAEWARVAAEGVTQDRLDRAKQYLTGSYPLRFDSNSKIAGALVGLQAEDLGVDYIKNRNSLVEAVTLDDIKRVAARQLKPEALSFVIVGAPSGLASN